MAQHFLLSKQAKSLSLASVLGITYLTPVALKPVTIRDNRAIDPIGLLVHIKDIRTGENQ